MRDVLRELLFVQREWSLIRERRGIGAGPEATGDGGRALGQHRLLRRDRTQLRFRSLQGTRTRISHWKMARIKGEKFDNHFSLLTAGAFSKIIFEKQTLRDGIFCDPDSQNRWDLPFGTFWEKKNPGWNLF